MRLAWQPIFEREWEQNSERFQIGKSLHLKEKRHFCKQALDNPSHGGGVLRFISDLFLTPDFLTGKTT